MSRGNENVKIDELAPVQVAIISRRQIWPLEEDEGLPRRRKAISEPLELCEEFI